MVDIGPGSGEILVIWARNQESDLDHYEIWWSEAPGGSKVLVDTVPHDPSRLGGLSQDLGGGRTEYTDVGGRSWDPGRDCYQVRAVDASGNQGPLPPEVCLPDPAPEQVTGLTVGPGGGSLEVGVIWRRTADQDIDHYEIWYSEQPGQAKAMIATVPDAPTGGRAIDLGDGRIEYIDYPRDLVDGTNCYQVAAVDRDGRPGPRSVEACYRG